MIMKGANMKLANAIGMTTLMVAASSPALLQAAESEYWGFDSKATIRAGLNFDFPHSDDNWDKGTGFNAQAVFWHTTNDYGIGINFNTSSWDAVDDVTTLGGDGLTTADGGRLDGDAQWTQIGVSALRYIEADMPQGMKLRAEAGILYTMASSDVDIIYTYSNNTSQTNTEELDIDNSLTGLLGLDLEYKTSDEISVYGGIGFQFDISEGEATAFTSESDNAISSLYIRGGVSYAFE
jgi:hypothetical protein